jgi:hypothetical protein
VKDKPHKGIMATLSAALQGVTIGTMIFLAVAFVLAAASARVDTSVIRDKIANAIRTSQIQYPGKSDINDKRGMDTFTDCLVLQATILNHGRLWIDMFDTRVYDTLFYHVRPEIHPCDALVDSFAGRPPASLYSYQRYWWGSATVARIALGMTGISIKSYRSMILTLSWSTVILTMLAFALSYGRASCVFLPLFISIGAGYCLLTMGQSIAQAPEFIVGLLLLSGYCVLRVQRFSLRARAALYSFLGGICVYFDLLDATVVLIAILLCCELTSPYADLLLKFNRTRILPSYKALPREIAVNCSLVLIGGCIAIVLRILGYSIVSHTNLLQVAHAWTSSLSYRLSGSLGNESSINAHPSLYRLLLALKDARQDPFHGILNKHAADGFYVLGFAAWALAIPLCWKLHRRGVPSTTVAAGFVIPAALVPVWYLVFEQHTIIHAWITGRLISLFCGLGMSLAVLMVWTFAGTASEGARGKRRCHSASLS